MEQNVATSVEPRYALGDKLQDVHSGKIGVVTSMYYSEGDACNPASWAYSIDHIGFFFYPEYDLIKATR